MFRTLSARLVVAPALAAALMALSVASSARAQTRYAEEPTAGLALPATPLAGDQDATSVALNPAGLVFLGGYHLQLALTGLDETHAHGAGTGIGVYAGTAVRLPFLPRLGFGIAAEQLASPRVSLSPDPGEPLRLSLAGAYEWQPNFSLGVAWRHFFDDGGAITDGVDTLDAGVSARFGAHWAAGAVVRDLFTPSVGAVSAQRRYQGELVVRPWGDARFELGLGGAVGERRLDWDGTLRLGWRVARGLTLRAELASLSRLELSNVFDPAETKLRHELRGSLGFEVSFGGAGAALYGTGGVDADGNGHLLGGTLLARWSGERLPSVVSRPDRIERIQLKGAIGQREHTRLVLRLRRLERDGHVKAVFVVFDGLVTGWGDAQELRDSLLRLRTRGKKVFAYLMAGTTREYYIAAAADQILMDSAGGVRMLGLLGSALFFKDLFDKIGVQAQFEKIEEFKSAPEAFTMNQSSDTARAMRDALFDDIYAQLTADLAKDRGRPAADWQAIFDAGPYTARDAGDAKLVDHVGEPAELDAAVAVALGRRYAVSDGDPIERDEAWARAQLAIVYLDGDIVDGKSMTVPLLGQKLSGGETIAQALAWARGNDQIKAVVLRVDSPGGSALASEVIAREVKALRGVKPIIISMGDVAASGGYFAAAYGDRIFAEPGTITGSIGIFTGKFDMSRLLGDLGLTWETTKRGAHADMESYLRPYTDEERATIKKKLRYYYEQFTGAVAKGRGMTMAQVDAVGRGRVWTGAQAKERGLVDEFGGLADAVAYAKAKAGFSETDRLQLVMLPREPTSLLGTLLSLVGGSAAADDTRAGVVPLVHQLLQVLPASVIMAPGTPQARLPFVIDWSN